jgi:alkanesulfonate monooxygenase SsuD/methylene tetrahydromethanopterin reductase-like flavin-dependent oxidoreductase (luciferase family)
MTALRIGVQFQTHGVRPPDFLASAELALSMGADSIFLWDHLVPFTGTAADSAWESWTLLGSIAPAVRNTNVCLGILVSPLTFRRPAILARAAATVAGLGNGQFILGVGAGGFDLDDVLAQTEMSLAERMNRFTNGLQSVVNQVRDQEQRHGLSIRVWVGGDGPRITIPAAAALADGWSGFGPPERFARGGDLLRSALKAGDGRKCERSVLLTPFDEPMDLGSFAEAGAEHVVRSLRPENDGTFDLRPISDLLSQRNKLTSDGDV